MGLETLCTDVLCFAGWLSGCKLQTTHHTIGKCTLRGETTLHWTTEYCFVQCGLQCTLTTNLQSTINSYFLSDLQYSVCKIRADLVVWEDHSKHSSS